MRDEYEITEAIQVLINDGEHVSTVNAVHDDVNLTYPADLLRVNLQLAQNNQDGNLIDEDAEVHPSARLKNTVVGAGAQVLSGAVITDCIVFESAVVASGSCYSNVIVTRDKVVSCQERAEDG